MRDIVQNLTAMIASLNTRMDEMDGAGRKKRKVIFRGATQDAMSMLSGAASLATSQPSKSWQQPHDHVTMPVPTPEMTQLLPPLAP